MAVRDILLLGNPQLYESSKAVNQQELESLKPVITNLHDTMMAFRQQWGVGRAIAVIHFTTPILENQQTTQVRMS